MSIQLQNKYLIQVDTANYRDSLVFLEDCREQIANIYEQYNGTINKDQMTCRSTFYSIFQGPEPTQRIVVNSRYVGQLTKQGQMMDNILGFNLVIYLLKMDKAQIQYDKIFERPTIQQQVRDALFHPNGRQIIIITKKTLQFYHIIKQLNSLNQIIYTLQLTKKQNMKADVPLMSYDNIISPSGQFILGIAQFVQGKSLILKAVKIDLSNYTLTFSKSVNECIQKYAAGIRKRGIISLDRDRLSKAVIVGNTEKVCTLDIATMEISIQSPIDPNSDHETIPRRVKQRNETIKVNETDTVSVYYSVFVNSNYLQIIDGGYFALFDQQNIIKLMKIHNNGSITYNTIYYNQVDSDQNNQEVYLSAQIPEIDSIVSIKRDSTDARIYKYVYDGNFTLDMGKIILKSFKSAKAEGIFYYEGNSEICFIFRDKVMCYKLYTKCTPDSPKTSIKQCHKVCQEIGKVWSPFKMQCIQCPQCKCNETVQFYNFYRKRCQTDCQKIKYASSGSGYAYNTKCQCIPPYIWDQNINLCRVNCDHIENTDPYIDYLQLQVDQCQCLSKYRYINQSMGFDVPGICALSCENGTKPIIKGKQQFCLCSENQIWDKRSLSCQKIMQSQIVFPVWSIVLIVLFMLGILAIFGYFVKVILNMIKIRNKDQSPQTPTTLNSPYTNQQKKMLQKTKRETQIQIENKITCVICKKNQRSADCIGPCGDKYHILCIKARFQSGNYECPACNRLIKKGYAELDLIDENKNNQ